MHRGRRRRGAERQVQAQREAAACSGGADHEFAAIRILRCVLCVFHVQAPRHQAVALLLSVSAAAVRLPAARWMAARIR